MRIREPSCSAPTAEFDLSPSEQSKTYEVTTITPIFGGGVEAGAPDTDMPVRASAIRGQLRYWWRFLASHRPDNPITDTQELFKAEREIWGGMGEKGEDYASKIFIRVQNIKSKTIQIYNGKQVGYALFPAKSEIRKNIPAKDLINEGLTFQLTIKVPKSEFENIQFVLRWWMSFGGIGARTRRGVGSICIKELSPINIEEALQHDCQLAIKHVRPDSALSAWNQAVQSLEMFRQKPGLGRNTGTGKIPGRSFWPEPDSLRQIFQQHSTKHSPVHKAMISFPRAYFGLPINFKFKNNELPESQLLPEKSERYASPLILTPYRIAEGKYAAAALRLPSCELENSSLQLKTGSHSVSPIPRQLSAKQHDDWQENKWNNWPQDWWQTEKSETVSPIHNNSQQGKFTNPLTAFMHYFGGKNA